MNRRKRAQRNAKDQKTRSSTGRRGRPGTLKGKQGRFILKNLMYPDQRVVRFPWVQGKTADSIELLTSARYHHITVEFADRTSLSFAIEPAFTLKAAYEYFRRGKPHAKLWPEIKSYK